MQSGYITLLGGSPNAHGVLPDGCFPQVSPRLITHVARAHRKISVAVTDERENAASDGSLAAVTQPTNKLSGMHGVFRGSRMAVLMAMCRVICRRLQLLALIGCQQSKDLLVVSLVLFLRFGATGRLHLGKLRDFCLLLVRQLQGLDELQGLLEAMNEASGIRATGWWRRVNCRRGRRGAGGLVWLGIGRGDGRRGFL